MRFEEIPCAEFLPKTCPKRPTCCPTTKKTPHQLRSLSWVEVGSGFEPLYPVLQTDA
jgi:hypothetical protein